MKRFNISEFIWFIILLVFTLYIYYLLITGRITLFVHPKLAKYSAFSLVILGELSVFQFFKIFTVKTRVSFKNGYIYFILVIIVGIFIAPGGLNSEIGDKKGITLVTSHSIENIGKHTHTKEELIIGNTIVFNDKYYMHYLEELSEDLDKHIGKKIIISGYVTKSSKLGKDEFILTRLLINCCAADSQVLGISCRNASGTYIEKDSWIRVEGMVSYKENRDSSNKLLGKLPLIVVDKITQIKKPANPYIYE